MNRTTVEQSPINEVCMKVDSSMTRFWPKAILPFVGVLSLGIREVLIEARELFTSYGVVGLGAYGAIRVYSTYQALLISS